MLTTIITIITIVACVVIWIISTQRRLVVFDENVSNAMNQIGVQLSGRFDVLMSLLDLTKDYARNEGETLEAKVKSERGVITAKSTPHDVIQQEKLITNTLVRIEIIANKYPALKTDQNYLKTIDALQTFEIMLRTSRLIYNDSVMKLNRANRLFPTSIVAGVLGFRQKEYLT